MTTHSQHNACIAARKIIRDRDPALFEKATVRGVWLTKGTPEHTLMLDLSALDAVASSFATGARVSKANQSRAERLLATL